MKKQQKPRAKEIFLQRKKCDCMGQKHELINNCLNCGKVVCAQQGQGPCLYCGKLVTRPDGMFIDDSSLYFPSLPKQEQQKISQERSKAIMHKNNLVERDKSQNQSQSIFDDQVDYYEISENKWLDQADRQKAIDKILDKDQFVQSESLKVKVKYDALTGEFIRQEFSFDQQAFKKQGREFLENREKQDKMQKEKISKQKNNWDQRVLRSDKLRDLCKDLLSDKPDKTRPKQQRQNNSKLTEIIIEDQ